MGNTMKRDHVMLTMRMKCDIPNDHHVAVTGDIGKGPRQNVFRGGVVAGEKLTICFGHALRGIEQTFARRVVASQRIKVRTAASASSWVGMSAGARNSVSLTMASIRNVLRFDNRDGTTLPIGRIKFPAH